MLSPLTLLLLTLCATAAAAVEPNASAPTPTPAENTASRLESIVEEMATGQQQMQQQGPATKPAVTDEVVILDGQERRELAPKPRSCVCTEYRNGANRERPYCAKPEGGNKIVCSPQKLGAHGSHVCNQESTPCAGEEEFAMATARASPAPWWKFNDAEEEDQVYLNAQFELRPKANAVLPPAAEYPIALALLAGMKPSAVSAIVASTMARTSGTSTPITVHATMAVKSGHKREALKSLLSVTEKLVVGGAPFDVLRIDFFDTVARPMVCGHEAENVKSEATALLRQLVALKEAEHELMRQNVQHAATTCNGPEMQSIADTFHIAL